MATRAVAMTVEFHAWDATNSVPKTGDAANITLRWVKDGTSAALTTTTVTEVDSTNAKGLYKCSLSATETDCTLGKLAGVSATAGVAVFGPTIGFDYIPNAAPGATNGLPQIGVAPLTNLDAAVTSRSSHTAAQAATSVWTDLLASSDFSTALSVGKLLKDDIDATISSRLATSGYTVPPSAASISTQVWTEPIPGTFAAGSAGAKLNSAGSAGDPWTTALPGAYGAGTAGKILGTFSFDGNAAVKSNLVDVNGTAATGVGVVPANVTQWNGTAVNALVGGNVPADLQTIKTQTVTAAAGVTFPASIGTSTFAGGAVASVTAAVSLNLAQTGLTPRALDSIADSALNVGDALVCAIAGAAGKENVVSGTPNNYIIKTPFTGAVIRTFVVDSITNPLSRT
jgi:hypothetical protein